MIEVELFDYGYRLAYFDNRAIMVELPRKFESKEDAAKWLAERRK